ncbi:MAG: lysylphosphatidylglycerol synthase transmembrane domain-containing protein [Candidatus Diapherotrites archaeon]
MSLRWFSILITLIIIYLAVTQLNIPLILRSFLSAELNYIGFALVFWLLLITIKSIKWQQMMRSLNSHIGLRESIRLLFIGLFISVATPGRLGDFARAYYVKDRLPIGKGIMAVLIDRAMDVFTLVVLATIGLAMLAQTKGVMLVSPFWSAGILLLLGVGTYFLLKRKWARFFWSKGNRVLPRKYHAIIEKYGGQFYDAIPLLKRRTPHLLLAGMCTLFAWACSITFGWFILLSLGHALHWEVALLTIPALALMEIIPAGILGIGTREVAAVIVLGAYSVSPESAIAFSLLYFALGYIPSFLLGAYFFNRHPFQMGKKYGWSHAPNL